jgi:hypothetical protein
VRSWASRAASGRPDDRFDIVWTLTRVGSARQFAQVAQLLLAGDRPDPIE